MKNLMEMFEGKSPPLVHDFGLLSQFVRPMNGFFGNIPDNDVPGLLAKLLDNIGFMPDAASIYLDHHRGQGEIAFLHYILPGRDYYLTRSDHIDTKQMKVLGLIDSGTPFKEVDFICLHELLRAGAQIDLLWQPLPLSQIQMRCNEN